MPFEARFFLSVIATFSIVKGTVPDAAKRESDGILASSRMDQKARKETIALSGQVDRSKKQDPPRNQALSEKV